MTPVYFFGSFIFVAGPADRPFTAFYIISTKLITLPNFGQGFFYREVPFPL
jgi:hypothetical protein